MKSENFIILDKEKFQILDFDGKDTKYEITKISKEFGDAYKRDYAHFTLKEIYEQPNTILRAGEKTIDAITKTVDYIKHAKNIYITDSGTSYNSALIAKKILSKYAKIKVETIISSEL
jgi:glucosamine--fructose-6-phosphate aminotransferase (isomerizing)